MIRRRRRPLNRRSGCSYCGFSGSFTQGVFTIIHPPPESYRVFLTHFNHPWQALVDLLVLFKNRGASAPHSWTLPAVAREAVKDARERAAKRSKILDGFPRF